MFKTKAMQNNFQLKNGILLLGMLLIMFSSCAPAFYAPSTQLQTDLHEKNDLTANIAVSIAPDLAIAPDFSIAYAPTNNIGIILSRNRFSDRSYEDYDIFFNAGTPRKAKYTLSAIGAGYFNQLNEKWNHEALLLYGKGALNIKSNHDDDDHDDIHLNATVKKIGLQYNITRTYDDEDYSISLLNNLSKLNYSKTSGYLANKKELEIKNNVILETALAFSKPLDLFNLQCQVGMSHNLSNRYLKQKRLYASVGIQFNIAQLYKPKKEELIYKDIIIIE